MKIFTDLTKNVEFLKKELPSSDVNFRSVKAGDKDGCIIFVKDMTDVKGVGNLIITPLHELKGEVSDKTVSDAIYSPEKKQTNDMNALISEIVNGNTALIIDGFSTAFSFGLKNFEKRPISEPPTSAVIKGPREGFVESLPVNISLMRRRLKTSDLIFENLEVGEFSKTQVSLCYIRNLADKELVESVKRKIQNINIKAALDSSYISKYLGEHKASLFKQVGNTEKPDILIAKILEGRVAVFVDGSPIVLTVPYLLVEDFQSPSDYYSSAYSATFSRLLRLVSVMISIFVPAFYVAAELFHLQLIPLSFLITIVNGIKGIPLSPSYEMIFTLLIFEILNETSVRMPKYVGMVVSIVGGLVLGETAVNAGIISAPTLMIVALSGICLYTVPELEQSFSNLRLVFLIIGGSLGGYALLAACAGTFIYLVSFENYSTPLMAPYAPLVKEDLKDGFIKNDLVDVNVKPLSLKRGGNGKIDKGEL